MKHSNRCGLLLSGLYLATALLGCNSGGSSSGAAATVEPEINVAAIDVSAAADCDVLDSSHCLLPFPNNFFTRSDSNTDTGLRINFAYDRLVPNIAGKFFDPTEWNRNDGFSPGPMMLAHVPGVDLEASNAPTLVELGTSLNDDSAIVVIDAETGEKQLIWGELDSWAEPDDVQRQALIIRAAKSLQEGRRYIVALREMKDSTGNRLVASDAFRVFRDNVATTVPALESRREGMERIFSDLERAGIARNELFLAWDFTVASTRNITERTLFLRDQALQELGDNVPSFSINEVVDSPVGDTENFARIVRGVFQVPNYLSVESSTPGVGFNYTVDLRDNPDAMPERLSENAMIDVDFSCFVPQTLRDQVSAGQGSGTVRIVGHGLFLDREMFTRFSGDPDGEASPVVSCLIDWWGMSSPDVPFTSVILSDVSQFPALVERVQHSYINMVYLAELLLHEEGLVNHDAFQINDTPLFDNSEVFFVGQSQGAVIGGGAMAIMPNINRGQLNIAGMNFSLLLRRSDLWELFRLPMDINYPDVLDQTVGFAVIQMLWDRGEGNGHANHLTRDPLPGTNAKKVLVYASVGDKSVNENGAELLARTIGARVHQPAVAEGRHIGDTPYVGIEPIEGYPYTGQAALVIWDGGPFFVEGEPGIFEPDARGRQGIPLQFIGNRPNTEGGNGHLLNFGPEARRQVDAFLQTDGALIDVCGDSACFAPGYDGTPGVFGEEPQG